MTNPYIADLFTGRRRATREVMVGDVGVGGENPLRVQSMVNTDTRDVRATVDQIESLAEVGCEIVRLTVPSIRDAEVLPDIRAELAKRKVGVPLVADIHFTPNAAMLSVDHVEKIRINPGNFVDKKKFEVREFSDLDYEVEIEKVARRFRPLVTRCKERGVSMRIGTNHGSLSDRIMNRFGDTPLGMVESALEFLDVCEAESFHDIVFSMKASNTQVAIHAYRMLAQRLDARALPPGGTYPFHVGITEAGDSEDGRIKSAIGIGALLEDGLGDTIRVSLTEHPVREVPVARALAERTHARWQADADAVAVEGFAASTSDPCSYTRRETTVFDFQGMSVGAKEPVRVELGLGDVPEADLEQWAQAHAKSLSTLRDVECELIEASLPGGMLDCAEVQALRNILNDAGLKQPLALVVAADEALAAFPIDANMTSLLSRLVVVADTNSSPATCAAIARSCAAAGTVVEWLLDAQSTELPALVARTLEASRAEGLSQLLFSSRSSRASHTARLLTACLDTHDAATTPIVLRHSVAADATGDAATLDLAIDLGAPLCDGTGDMVSITGGRDNALTVDYAYRVLQGSRLRATRTEFISCPSCGRTLFDLEEVTARIKSDTDHLKGVKIAIMGCIVNGPGEMADADFGYVGSGVGKVTLYVGKEVVVRSVNEDAAPGRLVELIKDSGSWIERA